MQQRFPHFHDLITGVLQHQILQNPCQGNTGRKLCMENDKDDDGLISPDEFDGIRNGTNGVSTNGVTANFVFVLQRDLLGIPVNILLPSQEFQGVAFSPICRNSLPLQLPVSVRPHSVRNQDICMYVCVYVYLYTYVYIYIYIYTHIHTQCIHTCVYIYIYTHTCVFVDVLIYAFILLCVLLLMHLYLSLSLYIYIYIYTYVYIYIYIYI